MDLRFEEITRYRFWVLKMIVIRSQINYHKQQWRVNRTIMWWLTGSNFHLKDWRCRWWSSWTTKWVLVVDIRAIDEQQSIDVILFCSLFVFFSVSGVSSLLLLFAFCVNCFMIFSLFAQCFGIVVGNCDRRKDDHREERGCYRENFCCFFILL